jgi:hypothetical protein
MGSSAINSFSSSSSSQSESESSSSSSEAESSSYLFSSFENFVESVSFDVSETDGITTTVDFSEDTTLDQMSSNVVVPDDQVIVMGTIIKSDGIILPMGGCVQQGYFPLENLGMYLECIPIPGLGFRPIIRNCATDYIFDVVSGSCIHTGAKNVLRNDLGFKIGPGPNIAPTVDGQEPLTELSDFPGINPICTNSGNSAFGTEDRYYLSCKSIGESGTYIRNKFHVIIFDITHLSICFLHRDFKTLPLWILL